VADLRLLGRVSAKKSTPFPVSSVLIIGGYPFGDYEHPPTLKFGLTQRDVYLESIGGTVDSQDLGAIHKDVTWGGYFQGVGAADRALTYKRMAYKGGEYLLQWQRERYYVKMKEFDWTYHTPNFGEYLITVGVLRDASGQLKKANVPNIDQQTSALASSANSFSTIIASNDVSAAAANVASLTSAATGALPTIQPIAQNQGNAGFLATLTNALTAAQNYATKIAPYANLISGVLPNSHIYTALGLVNTLSLIGANVSSGQPPKIEEVFGGTFSALAAREYGDPSLWSKLAAANGFASNIIPSGKSTTVRYPPLVGSKIS
jgi:hypothetical protein